VVDTAAGFAYFSFTTSLVKTDLHGNLIGSVKGLTGHLGCLTRSPFDGRVYGSLEYKNDNIGLGIDAKGAATRDSRFYIAIFDVNKITRPDMDAEKDGVMTAVFLQEPTSDYYAKKLGCSGIDGVTFAPDYGKGKNGKMYLNVAYGVYSDTTRTDNDYQVILSYDVSKWKNYEKPISQNDLHQSGPTKPRKKLYVYTGNTSYGVQNLAFDPSSGNTFMAVYAGQKSWFPNYSLFATDGSVKPRKEQLKGMPNGEKGEVVSLLQAGEKDESTGVRGWRFPYGTTGLCPVGGGLFYISHNGKTPEGLQSTELFLYKWNPKTGFEKVE
jgi:hypothetical protein